MGSEVIHIHSIERFHFPRSCYCSRLPSSFCAFVWFPNEIHINSLAKWPSFLPNLSSRTYFQLDRQVHSAHKQTSFIDSKDTSLSRISGSATKAPTIIKMLPSICLFQPPMRENSDLHCEARGDRCLHVGILHTTQRLEQHVVLKKSNLPPIQDNERATRVLPVNVCSFPAAESPKTPMFSEKMYPRAPTIPICIKSNCMLSLNLSVFPCFYQIASCHPPRRNNGAHCKIGKERKENSPHHATRRILLLRPLAHLQSTTNQPSRSSSPKAFS